jgi:hypothetical protein
MAPRLPELVKRARRLATERDRLVQELAREWTKALRGQGFSARDLDELWAGLTEETVRRLLQTGGPRRGRRGDPARSACEIIARVRARRASLPRADKATALLRTLPGVDALVTRVAGHAALAGIPRRRLTEAAREVLAAERRSVIEGASAAAAPAAAPIDALAERVVTRLSRSGVFSLARVVNATGVVLHTNLGRPAPLWRRAAAGSGGGVLNLEMDGGRKERGSRRHVDALLQRLTGPRPRSWSTTARRSCSRSGLARQEVIVCAEADRDRGEFRIPDIMGRRSDAARVGATSRTHLKDYARRSPGAGLLLKVRTSSHRVVRHTAAVSSHELAGSGASGACR